MSDEVRALNQTTPPTLNSLRIQQIRDWQDTRQGFQYHGDIQFLLDLVDRIAHTSGEAVRIDTEDAECQVPIEMRHGSLRRLLELIARSA